MNKDLKIPNHVGIIMDGNGRWAEKRGFPRSKGHYEGMNTLKKTACYALEKGVKVLSVFAFSTENFLRSDEEVNYLMDLFVKAFKKEKNFFQEKNIKVIFSGRKKPLSDKVIKSMETITEVTKNNTEGIFNVCLNYGGQFEIIDASIKIANDLNQNKITPNEIDENLFYKYLYNDLPPIDFLIRTSGEMRVSNFMLFQMAYAEIYFPEVYFPDFDEKEFDKAILEFNKRSRRFGGNDKRK